MTGTKRTSARIWTRGGVAGCATLLLMAGTSIAQSTPLVCSVERAVECDEVLECGAPVATPERAVPTFLHVDQEEGVVTILDPEERRGETTRIQATEVAEDRTVLTGIEAGRGWTMVLSDVDGSMTLTVTDRHVAFVVFGQCLSADRLSP